MPWRGCPGARHSAPRSRISGPGALQAARSGTCTAIDCNPLGVTHPLVPVEQGETSKLRRNPQGLSTATEWQHAAGTGEKDTSGMVIGYAYGSATQLTLHHWLSLGHGHALVDQAGARGTPATQKWVSVPWYPNRYKSKWRQVQRLDVGRWRGAPRCLGYSPPTRKSVQRSEPHARVYTGRAGATCWRASRE